MAILGIDISQHTFDATVIDDTGARHYQQFSNDMKGFQTLHAWLNTHPVSELHACMEATNVYWEELAEELSRLGYQVSVVNPARTKGFAMSQLKRNKTDKLDSGVIADFCERMTPQRWTPPSPEQRQLREMVRHLDSLKKTRTQHTNRLKTCRNPVVRGSLQAIIETLNAQITEMGRQIDALFSAQPSLKAQKTTLVSIQGIGAITATKLLSEMYDLGHYQDARAAAADAGLHPVALRIRVIRPTHTASLQNGQGVYSGSPVLAGDYGHASQSNYS